MGAASTASAGVAGLSGVGTGIRTFTECDPTSAVVRGSGGSAWSMDLDNGTASINNTAAFFGFVWTAKNLTFVDNGKGTYSGNMLFD